MNGIEWETDYLPAGPPLEWVMAPKVVVYSGAFWSITLLRRNGFSSGYLRRWQRQQAERLRRPFYPKRHRRMAGK